MVVTRTLRVRMKSMDSADSDEEYVAEVDDVDQHSDELDSLVADASEEDSSFTGEDDEEEEEEDDEEEEEWRKPRAPKLVTRSRKNQVKSEDDEVEWGIGVKSGAQKGYGTSRKNRLKREAEVDVEEEDKGGGWRTVVKPRVQMGSARSRKNGVRMPKKRRKVTSNVSENSDDDDDEEFTPNDFDSLEEDEEVSYLRTKKRRRTPLKGKSSVNSQRRKRTAKTIRRTVKRKNGNTGSLERKTNSGDDEDFTDKRPVLRTRGKKKPLRRNKRVADGSGSDFCSDSSDFEFTISEEEQEQVREANQICRSLKPNLRCSRKSQEDEAFCGPRKPPVRKGKEKAEETKNDEGKSVCGVCLTEEGKNTIRGTLNCCSHYFCFACIMEWSKVESRCPVCKQRFVTISKPARCVKGFDLRSVVIQVPQRDQVYQPSEEELRGFLNPYEDVICTECHEGGDDALMLLCDICDSPAHTYCVGLGREVPEGNWYCDGCRPALGSSHSQTQVFTPDRRSNADASDGLSTYENMTEIDLNVTIPETPISQGNEFLASPRYPGGSFQASSTPGMGVSTVSRRRTRMQNWILNIFSDRSSQAGDDTSSPRPFFARVNSTFQPSQTTDVGTSYHAQHVDRLHEGSSHNVLNGDLFPGRMAQMMGQLGEASSSTNGSVYGHVGLNGMGRVNLRAIQTQISSSEQLRPCTSRSSMLHLHSSNEEHANRVRQQVHLLVRSELKSLSRDMNLGHDAYAEISRRSVDTVMAACGLEPRRSDVYEAQLPLCLHVERFGNVQSSPMSGCCLTCFENFVKDVVRRIIDITLGPHWSRF